MRFARDFVDSCDPSLSRAPNPHSSLQTRPGGVSFLVVGAPPPYSVNGQRESEGVSSCLSCPLQHLPVPRPCLSTPSLCVLRQRHLLHHVPAPSVSTPLPLCCATHPASALTPLACALRQCPQPVRCVNALACAPRQRPPACAPCQRPRPARCVDAPSLRAASTPPSPALCPCLCIDTPAWCAVSMPSHVQEEGLLPGVFPSLPLALDKL